MAPFKVCGCCNRTFDSRQHWIDVTHYLGIQESDEPEEFFSAELRNCPEPCFTTHFVEASPERVVTLLHTVGRRAA